MLYLLTGEGLMNRKMLSGAASFVGTIVMAAGIVGVTSAATVSFLDETFDDANWSMAVLQENFISENFTAGQQSMGGMPGEYRRNFMVGAETTNNGGVGPASATVGHFWESVGWDPSTQGPVNGVMYSMNAVAFDDRPSGQTVPTGVQVSMIFLLRQAGVVYVRNPSTGITFPDGIWRLLTANAPQATSFTRDDQQPGHPDFSTAGAPIEFGYFTRAGAFVPAISNHFGVDNFQVAISTVPEPGAFTLAVMTMLSAAGWRRSVRAR
jgi:hypothetical protein